MNQIQFVVEAIRCFDKTAGNTYHACMITRTEDGTVLRCPFQYGYGDAYKQTALEAMATAGWLPEKYREVLPNGVKMCYLYERENNYPILWNVSDGTKRNAKALGGDKA